MLLRGWYDGIWWQEFGALSSLAGEDTNGCYISGYNEYNLELRLVVAVTLESCAKVNAECAKVRGTSKC